MIGSGAGDGTPGESSLGWEQVFTEVLRHQTGNSIEQAVQHANPRREKVQASPPSRYVLPMKEKWQIEERRSSLAASFTPIETGVSQEYGNAADDKRKKAEGVDPVGNADQGRMPRRTQNL
jgi:hypothetical protein